MVPDHDRSTCYVAIAIDRYMLARGRQYRRPAWSVHELNTQNTDTDPMLQLYLIRIRIVTIILPVRQNGEETKA